MRRLPFILLLHLTCLSFGQDSLQADTSLKTVRISVPDSVHADTVAVTQTPVAPKKSRKKKTRPIKSIEEHSVAANKITEDDSDTGSAGYVIAFLALIIVVALILAFFVSKPITRVEDSSNSQINEYISDYLSRLLLSRRDYYREVYLKSDAWMRKRNVVLRRDNWRCVYCGGRATQVHHTRYAKRNIGKEPIEWLVSICNPCHRSQHQ